MAGWGNSWKHSPARQARLTAQMIVNKANPEWVRREEIKRKARGKILGHFNKKDLVSDWNREWNQAGRPDGMPDFPEWLAAKRPELIKKRDEEREQKRLSAERHAEWVSRQDWAKNLPAAAAKT